LAVPEGERQAFKEYYSTLREKFGGAPDDQKLKGWKKDLQQARSEAEVRAHFAGNCALLQLAVDAVLGPASERGEGAEDRIWRLLHQRFVFLGVYAPDTSLDDLLGRLRVEAEGIAANAPSAAVGGLRLAPGVFDKPHATVREAAYSYTPACGSWNGDAVLECTSEGTLAGYMAMHGSYADDLSVKPEFQGRGIGKALICGVAARLAKQGQAEMSLDVRACNLPAQELYKSLGFGIEKQHFPGFYD